MHRNNILLLIRKHLILRTFNQTRLTLQQNLLLQSLRISNRGLETCDKAPVVIWPKQLLGFSQNRERKLISKETHLQTKLVEEVIYEIFGTINKSVIQMESCNVMKDGFRHRGCEIVSTPIVFLMAVNCNLKG